MAQPLALDSAPAGQGAGWRKGQDLIDALPYVDRLTPEEKQRVDKLIQEEVSWIVQLSSLRSLVHASCVWLPMQPQQPSRLPTADDCLANYLRQWLRNLAALHTHAQQLCHGRFGQLRPAVAPQLMHCHVRLQMKNSTQRPAAYLKDLPPAYELNLEVSARSQKLPSECLGLLQLFCGWNHCVQFSRALYHAHQEGNGAS